MPIKIQSDLPAKKWLDAENIFTMDESRALSQEIRPLQICILNLMPNKQETEVQLLRALSNTPLQVDVSFLYMDSHTSKNTAQSHLNKFYNTFEELKDSKFDGLIITGAPVEKLAYEEVDYWKELCEVMEWSKTHVTSTFHICWASQAAMYYHYGLKKEELNKKRFGIFNHKLFEPSEPLVRGFDDFFLAPHSRYTEVLASEIHQCKQLKVLAESADSGVMLAIAEDGKQIFAMGHLEYDRMTLHKEYMRDVESGEEIEEPAGYYTLDEDNQEIPYLLWRAHATLLFSNWLNYYVYQVTPFEL